MRHQTRSLIGCGVLVLGLAAAWRAFGASSSEPMILFGVTNAGPVSSRIDPEKPTIDAIAFVQRSRRPGGTYRVVYTPPPHTPGGERQQSAMRAFEALYYKPGRTFTVVTSGVETGYVRVKAPVSLGCVSLAAMVDLHAGVAPATLPTALAVGSLRPKRRKESWPAPTDAEYEAVQAFTRGILAKKGVPRALLKTAEPYIAAADLHADGDIDYAVTVGVSTATTHDELFLLVTQTAAGLRADMVEHLHHPQRTDDHEGRRWLVDHFDFEEDGVDELVTIDSRGESSRYEIWRRERPGRWTRVYSGGGSGC